MSNLNPSPDFYSLFRELGSINTKLSDLAEKMDVLGTHNDRINKLESVMCELSKDFNVLELSTQKILKTWNNGLVFGSSVVTLITVIWVFASPICSALIQTFIKKG